MNRLQFLNLLGIVVASNPLWTAAKISFSDNRLKIDRLSRSMFENQLHSRFLFYGKAGEIIHAELVDVSDRFTKNKDILTSVRNQQYSMLFRYTCNHDISSSIYTMSQPELGDCDLFLSPTLWQNDGCYFEIIINHTVC
jgi:hypothetical protein